MILEQTEIPGTEAPVIAIVERKGKIYANLKAEMATLKEKVDDALIELVTVMQDNNVDIYRLKDGTVVRVTDKKGIKLEMPKKSKGRSDKDDKE